jgi:hypothetical protein
MKRTQARTAVSDPRSALDEEYFERKARDLIVADDEIEAWEFDAQEIEIFGAGNQGRVNGVE